MMPENGKTIQDNPLVYQCFKKLHSILRFNFYYSKLGIVQGGIEPFELSVFRSRQSEKR